MQSALWRTSERFVAVRAGRGSGKTELARRRVVRFLPVQKRWADPMYFYALPTYKQARRVAWRAIKRLVPKAWLLGPPNESDMRIDTIFGSSLYVVGMDKPERLEGNQWDGGVVDESADQKPKSFDLSILPALSWRNGWCWRIGVPKRHGVGAHDFNDFYDSLAPGISAFTWSSEDILSPEQLAWAREHMDPIDYDEQYRANVHDIGGSIFHAFSDAPGTGNVQAAADYRFDKQIVVGSDFNVDPMCWTLSHIVDDEFHTFDELFIRNCNTRKALDALFSKYPRHEAGWHFIGDATGQARKTSASESDYLQIKNDERFRPKRVSYPKVNPRLKDRFASANALLLNAAGHRRWKIHPRCRYVVIDLKTRGYKEGTSEPNDSHDQGHMSDAATYPVHRLFPIRLAGKTEVILGSN